MSPDLEQRAREIADSVPPGMIRLSDRALLGASILAFAREVKRETVERCAETIEDGARIIAAQIILADTDEIRHRVELALKILSEATSSIRSLADAAETGDQK